MKLRKLRSKYKIFISFFITTAMIIASCFGFVSINVFQDITIVSANTENITTIKDPNFNDKTGSYPISPSTENYETSSPVGNSNVTAGIINNSDSKYSKYPNNPDSSDQYYLMISSEVENSTPSNYIKFGYRTTDGQIELQPDSNYEITVDVLTDNADGIGSLYLFNKVDGSYNYNSPLLSIKNINTVYNPGALIFSDSTKFIKCHFFISTNDITSYSLQLGMYLEGKGTVLFDNICINKISDNFLKSQISNGYEYYDVLTKTDNVVENYTVDNGKLDFNVEQGDLVENNPIDTNGTNTKAYYVKADNTIGLVKMTEDITLKQNKVYKITAYAKAKGISGPVKLKLKETTTLSSGESAHDDAYIALSNSSDLENATYGYQAYSFYLRTYTSHDAKFNLQLALGEDSNASAEIYISSVVVTLCNYSDFNSATEISKVEMVKSDLNESVWIDNGNFDLMEITDYTKPYPALATNWTFANKDSEGNEIKDGTQYYGVVNNSLYSEMINTLGEDSQFVNLLPQSSPYNIDDNFLMLYTNSQNTLSATSAVKNLDKNSYYQFNINAYSINAPVTISLVSTINGKEVTLVSKDIEGNEYWHYSNPITLHIFTGNQNMGVSVRISVKTTGENIAVACADEVLYSKNSNMTAEEFAMIDNSIKADWSTIRANNIIPTNDVKTNISNINISTTLNDDEILKSLISDNKNVIGIYSTLEKVYATYQSNIGFSLETGDDKYYQISVQVYTKDLDFGQEDNIDANNVGVAIGLSGYEKFTAIKSNTGWTTYTFYIKPTAASTTFLEFELGSSEIPVSGYMYVGDIQFKTIDKTTFETKNASNTVKVITTTPEEDSGTEDEEPENNGNSDFSWDRLPYYISSIIFALAIIATVIGVLARKVKWKKPTNKKTKTAYDRTKTVSKQYYARRATTLREERIAELNKELNNLIEQRTKYEEEYKRDLSKLRELKIKRAPANEISAMEKQLKKNQKMSASIGVNINRIEPEIEYTKTDAYLASLIKKLEREQVEIVEEPVDNKVEEEIQNKTQTLKNDNEPSKPKTSKSKKSSKIKKDKAE